MRVPTACVPLPLPHWGLLEKSLFLGLELRFAQYLPLPSALRGADLVLPLIWNYLLGVETLPSKLCSQKTQLGLVVWVMFVALQVGRHLWVH